MTPACTSRAATAIRRIILNRFSPVSAPLATASFMQDAVEPGAVFFNRADPDSRNGEQLSGGGGTAARDGLQGLIAEDAECRDAAPLGLGESPGAQGVF